jgi:hypothetical protein
MVKSSRSMAVGLPFSKRNGFVLQSCLFQSCFSAAFIFSGSKDLLVWCMLGACERSVELVC